MKIQLHPAKPRSGFVLLLVVVLAAVSIIILAGVMNRTSTVSLLNLRSTQLNDLDHAAEAALEKVYAKMAWDFQANGLGQVANNLASYRALIPNSSDNAYWSDFTFYNPISGTMNSVYVEYITNYSGPLPAQFTNQVATISPIYRLACNVIQSNSLVRNVIGTAQMDVLLALVPITTYTIFYNGELEFSTCATMAVAGRVHANDDICVGAGSSSTLTFTNQVTAVGVISAPPRGGSTWTENDPTTWRTTFFSGFTSNNPTVNIAIQMTNTHSIIDLPSVGESVASQQGTVRLYNQAQVVLIITNSPGGGAPRVILTLQTPYNGSLPGADTTKVIRDMTNTTEIALQTNAVNSLTTRLPFLSLTNTFNDARQNQANPFVTQIDIAQYKGWLTTNTLITGKFTGGALPTILYVADQRNIGTSRHSVVRLINGESLPFNDGLGFSVATPNPLYVKGHYNVTVNGSTYAYGVGSTTNGSTVPAAVLCDALTLLSPNWTDGNSYGSLGSRNAASMTFNAAIVTGNVPSTGTTTANFSGGVHNITRLLEDWSGDQLTLNTSIVVLYASNMATNQFRWPGDYYNPPTRRWGFDEIYYKPEKQPPGVPCALVPIRFNWAKPPPGAIASY